MLILMNIPALLRSLKPHYTLGHQDITIGIKQLSQYLMTASSISFDDEISYIDEEKQKNTITLDHHRLVKRPGYETLIYDIDHVSFSSKDHYLYMKVTRGSYEQEALISDLYYLSLSEEESKDEQTQEESADEH